MVGGLQKTPKIDAEAVSYEKQQRRLGSLHGPLAEGLVVGDGSVIKSFAHSADLARHIPREADKSAFRARRGSAATDPREKHKGCSNFLEICVSP